MLPFPPKIVRLAESHSKVLTPQIHVWESDFQFNIANFWLQKEERERKRQRERERDREREIERERKRGEREGGASMLMEKAGRLTSQWIF